jgi:hypothetical protein
MPKSTEFGGGEWKVGMKIKIRVQTYNTPPPFAPALALLK